MTRWIRVLHMASSRPPQASHANRWEYVFSLLRRPSPAKVCRRRSAFGSDMLHGQGCSGESDMTP